MNRIVKEIILFLSVLVISLVMIIRFGGITNDDGKWGINNEDCVGCGGCATTCVLPKSAVIAVMNDEICAHRADCPAFFKGGKIREDREYDNCPTGALIRTDNGDGTFNYSIDEDKCIGCGKCTKLCQRKGEGALTLVIDGDKCVDCDLCQISVQCPTDAVNREKAK